MWTAVCLFSVAFALQCSSLCPLHQVSSTQLGNKRCDLECNNSLCSFDSDSTGRSDCSSACEATGCAASLLGNQVCDAACDSPVCGFDQGDCGFCASGCFYADLDRPKPECSTSFCISIQQACEKRAPGCQTLLGNQVCDLQCFLEECAYDGLDCGLCSPACGLGLVGNGRCDAACLTELCNYDAGDCTLETTHNCSQTQIGNHICEQSCYFADTQWDLGDCDCAPGCSHALQHNTECEAVCAVSACHFDSGQCVFAR